MPQTRQLAAIMFADISGYTALMQQDEQKALGYLNHFKEVLEKNSVLHKGKIIQYFGDGCLLAFDSSTSSVECAMDLQKAFQENVLVPVRIGLHLGDVVFRNENVFGDGVNIASRIESLGIPGSVLLSKSIRDQIKNKSDFQLTSLGSFDFKNVEETIEVFAISNPGFEIPRREEMQGKLKQSKNLKSKFLVAASFFVLILAAVFILKDSIFQKQNIAEAIKSLAILPFENLQNDSTLFYLSDGIPENLINRFSALEGIKVFARSSTFGLADSSRKIKSLHKLLNADMVLTGQLEKKGTGYFLNCELVDAANQNLIWGNKYELTSNDISKIEDSIIASLMNPLQIALIDKSKGLQKKEVNPEAYAEYLKGRYLSYGSTSEESEKALMHFREAIRLDPKYAAAYAAIANEKVTQALFSTAAKNEIVNEARTALEAAKALDPDLSDIYTTEGALKFYYDWDWEGAVNSYKKALKLDPGNATIYIRYSATLADIGKYKEALPFADKAVELDPVSISSLHNLGWTNLLAGNFKKSTEAFGKALELHPNWIWGHIKKAYGHIFLKEYDKALPLARRAEELFKDSWGSELLQVTLVFIYKNCNKKEKADSVANRFLKYASENTLEDPWNLSYIYYLKGDYKKANEWEEKTIEMKSLSAYLLNLPLFYNKEYFQSEAHQNILKKMGFVK